MSNKKLPLLLAYSWKDEDPTGWWMSEKLDGVRALWDGEKFISRLSNEYRAPQWFLDKMPKNIKLDGELFGGRGNFDKTVGAVKKHEPIDEEWKQIRFMVFDIVDYDEVFENRMAYLKDFLKDYDALITLVEQIKVKNKEHMLTSLVEVQKNNGEGLMLRKANSKYIKRKSKTLLKVKTTKDTEAKVIGYKPGSGKHTGRVGSLICEMPNGKTFKLGTGLTDTERENPPKIGSLVTYSYQELTKSGKPRFPAFITVRDYE